MKDPLGIDRRRRAKPSRDGTAQAPPDAAAPAPGAYAPAVKVGVQTTVQTVQDMHHAIADQTFDGLRRVPGLSFPTRVVQGMHDAITQGVYAAVRHGSGALVSMAGAAEQLATDTTRTPQGRELAVRSALNGVFGDALSQAGSSLSPRLGFHADGSPLPLTAKGLRGLRARVCVFVHGLACDEQSWFRDAGAWQGTIWEQASTPGQALHYGALLAREWQDISPVYLRYNTGLAVADNARELARQLDRLVEASPPSVRELVLVGHSMGGLVVRGACELAAADGMAWLRRARLVVCLGTPHQGALLEQLGHVANLALGVSKVTRPLARVAHARSQGIKDLRHGLRAKGKRRTPEPPPGVALRLIAARLDDATGSVLGSLAGKALGDGLVLPSSASDDGLVGDVQRIELAGLGHMALLNHPRVYEHLRQWVAETGTA
jgi:pimeloyl-ACP methyl ester carboxylesterase